MPVTFTSDARTTSGAARGIGIGKLERKALDDVGFQAGCSMSEPFSCCDACWQRWVGARLVEHLRGERYWAELDRGDFGLLRRRADLDLFEEVMDRVAAGADTLAVLGWAARAGRPFDGVAAILRMLGPDLRRLPRFPWLSRPVVSCGRA